MKDLFSKQSVDYAKYRPSYPEGLFQYLAGLCGGHDLVWDAGTGNGQAAVALANHFDRVVATDLSAKQIALAQTHPKVEYQTATAEKSPLADSSCDLITVAQAFHWFHQEEFFREVRRVAKPGAHLAIWCYEISEITPSVDKVVSRLYEDYLGPYWDPARRLVEQGYRNEKIPFAELAPPSFSLEAQWNLSELIGYLGTWSALQKYKEAQAEDPLAKFEQSFLQAWGNPQEKRKVRWPLSLRTFQVS